MDEIKYYEGSMRTTENGQLMISSKYAFDQFFIDNPQSSFSFKITKISNESRKKLIAYYFAEVIPKVIRGYYRFGEILTKKEAIERLSLISVVCKEECLSEDNYIIENIKDVYSLNYFELQRHIQEVIIFAAENLETVIEEPI